MTIILATTSKYRRRLMERLQLEFRCVPPQIDESPLPGETPVAMAERLALEKARAVAERYPESVVIGSDQVATLSGHRLGKPGNFAAAFHQLKHSSGSEVEFHTGVALICLAREIERFHVEPYKVKFRPLSEGQISLYLRKEEPFDCAGSFKVEGLGITLFERLTGDDPTSLEGLPLIRLSQMLAEAGIHVLGG